MEGGRKWRRLARGLWKQLPDGSRDQPIGSGSRQTLSSKLSTNRWLFTLGKQSSANEFSKVQFAISSRTAVSQQSILVTAMSPAEAPNHEFLHSES